MTILHVNICNLSYFICRRKPIPSLPNQASEGQAHCMMELAKRLLLEAGGSQSTVIFNASQGSQNNPQRSGIFFFFGVVSGLFQASTNYNKKFPSFHRSSPTAAHLFIPNWTLCFGLEQFVVSKLANSNLQH